MPVSVPSKIAAFGDVLMPEDAMEPILAKPVRSGLLEWLTEIWAAEDLKAVNLQPRKRAIFHGPPGTGKTTLAHHLAARLGLPMLVVRSERLQSKYVSDTSKQIGDLFDALHGYSEPIFLFFDEFDTMAAKRTSGNSANPVAEQDHNGSINALLANFDRYKGFVVAATNFDDRIDEALWRRFEIQIEIALPGEVERRHILERYLAPFVLPEKALKSLAIAMDTATPALMRQFAEHLKRQIVVGPKAGWDMGKEACFSRLLATISPHADLGKPRLWSHRENDKSLLDVPWPLMRTLDDYAVDTPAPARTVVPMRPRGREA